MTRTITIALLGAASIAMSACQKPAASADPDAVKKAIAADEKQWNADFKSKNTEALVGHYAADAHFVAPGVSADGSTEIRRVFATTSADKNFEVQFASDRVDVAASRDLAYARGHFSEKYTDEKTGQVMSGSGTYVTVYKKQQDGSWKVVEDVAAADPATVKPVPPAKPATRARMVSF